MPSFTFKGFAPLAKILNFTDLAAQKIKKVQKWISEIEESRQARMHLKLTLSVYKMFKMVC